MINEMLQLQQYMNIHPVINENKKYRKAYVSLIKHLSEIVEDRQWSNSMIRLMKERILGKGYLWNQVQKEGNSIFFSRPSNYTEGSILYGIGELSKYSYNILTDCLFINAFNDEKAGKKILDDVLSLFDYLGYEDKNKLNKLFENFYQVDLKEIKKDFPMMEGIYRIISSNRAFLLKNEKRIMITANMSAGKSTLLNALAGKKVNKTQNDTCTAKIHYLYNKAGEDDFDYELDHDLDLNASSEVLMEDNDKNASIEIVVGTRFRSIKEIDSRVCFIDTPGVNSSQNKDHRKLTDEVISEDNCDLLIFLLNGENIGTEDDIRHLRYVKEVYHGKILFLVNKLDRFKNGIDSVYDTLEKIKEDLNDLGYANPKVYPISAYAAYLAKLSIYGETLTDDEIDDMNFRKRKLSREEFRYDMYFDELIPKIDENDENEVLLRNSGILSLERLLY